MAFVDETAKVGQSVPGVLAAGIMEFLDGIENRLTLAVTEPSNMFLIDEVASITGLDVQVVVTTHKDVTRMLTSLPNSKVFVIDDIIEDSEAADVTLIEQLVRAIAPTSGFTSPRQGPPAEG